MIIGSVDKTAETQDKYKLKIYQKKSIIILKKRYERRTKMIIKASAALRNDYASISNLAKESNEPIYITKNGEGDMVLMSIEAYEKREQLLQLRAKVLQAEQERIDGAPTISVAEARKKLRERLSEL